MSAMVFVDVLAYAGAGMGVLVMLYLGVVLMRTSTAVLGLAAFIGKDRARECFQDGSFRTSQARSIGALFVMLAAFIGVCIVRGMPLSNPGAGAGEAHFAHRAAGKLNPTERSASTCLPESIRRRL